MTNHQISANGQFHIALIENETAFDGLQQSWETLWNSCDTALAAQEFTYAKTAWQNVWKDKGGKLAIVTVTSAHDERLFLIWPLVHIKKSFATWLRPLNSGSTEYDNLLCAPDFCVENLLSEICAFVQVHAPFDLLQQPYGLAQRGASTALAQLALASEGETLPATAVARPEGDWPTYWQSRSSNLRNGLGRRARRLAEKGEVKFECVTAPETRKEIIAWTIAHKIKWMEAQHLSHPALSDPSFERFLNAYSDLMVFTLRCGGQVIASKLGMKGSHCFEGFLTAYDVAFHPYSPSQLLLREFIQWCFAEKLICDFRFGEESYKDDWANQSCQLERQDLAYTVKGAATLYARKFHRFIYRQRAKLRFLKKFLP